MQSDSIKILDSLSLDGGALMEQIPTVGLGARRNEDIALDMMKFIAATTGIGKPGITATGFTGATPSKPEDYAGGLLELYLRCLNAVQGRK